ncbi:MAG: hypothetical protein K1X74_04510 [Pirellulales bacterium]|nr:hypothetical protein [Pirellulales bacterium]
MKSPPLTIAECETAKRELRAEIGRLRRRVDRRLQTTRGELRGLVSWQSQVRRHPAWTVGLGLGLGWLLAGGWNRSPWLRTFTREAGKLAAGLARERAFGELATFLQTALRSRSN